MLITSQLFRQGKMCLIVLGWFSVIFVSGCLRINLPDDTPAEYQTIEAIKTPTHFWTAKEAYQRVQAHVKTWHKDSVFETVTAPNAEDPAWKINADGRSPWWYFTIYSPSEQVETAVTLMDDVVILGREGIPGLEKPRKGSSSVVNLDDMIDSNQAMLIAYQSGVDEGYFPEVLRWDTLYGQPGTYSWSIGFWRGIVLEERPRIIIDAKTGEVIHNDFLNPQE